MRTAAALILAGAISLGAPGAAWSQAAATKGAAAPQAAPEAANSNSIVVALPAPPRPNAAIIPRLAPQ